MTDFITTENQLADEWGMNRFTQAYVDLSKWYDDNTGIEPTKILIGQLLNYYPDAFRLYVCQLEEKLTTMMKEYEEQNGQ